MKWILWPLVLLGIPQLGANPIVVPAVVMTGENVIVDASHEGVLVTGRYRFRVTEDRAPNSDPQYLPVNTYVQLPIPVPESTVVSKSLAIELAPELILDGSTVKGSVSGTFSSLPSISGVKFISVDFDLRLTKVEFDVTIRYHQPIIRRDGKFFAYYLPLLPNYTDNKDRYKLKDDAYVVSFEALLGTTLKLHTPNAKVLQYSPTLVSLQAMNREVLEVEIFPTAKPSSPR